jgi:hypothetical protein
MKIIGISGRKQAGKNTCANYITGHILKSKEMVQDFHINDNGELEIQTFDSNGKIGWGVFDILRKDRAFVNYAEQNLWPFVKVYHFADSLKQICNSLFGFTLDQVYGSDDNKNQLTHLLWENMPENHENLTGPITAREFMQHFGTNIIRKIKDDAWVSSTMSHITEESSEVAIIPDVRFPNEVEAIHKCGGVVIRLTRDTQNSDHKCETALDKDNFDWSKFNLVVDNTDKSILELSEILSDISYSWRI